MVSGAKDRKTKIVATIGPATRSRQRIRELILAGTNVFRLNFSHGSPEEHLSTLELIRKASDELSVPVGVLQDLAGPKLRITKVQKEFIEVADNQKVELRFAPSQQAPQLLSSSEIIFVETVDPCRVLCKGQQVLLADGTMELRVEHVSKEAVLCRAIKGSKLRSRIGISFPDSKLDLPATTDKDLKDFKWGLENGIDYVAVSFVQNADDVRRLRELVQHKHSGPKLIAKIERRAAVDNIEEIIEVSDGLMVARGDLGLELPLERVPLVQRHLIERANYYGIPVIVATQMLHSMITSTRPTRAEVTDIAFAVMSGADAVMLSEETTIGEHPIECVNYLAKIAHEAEKYFVFDEYKLRLRDCDRLTVPDAVAYAACAAAIKVNASAIVVCTTTGNSVRLVAKYRPQQPLYGVSSSEDALRRMTLFWGVWPIRTAATTTHQDELEMALRTIQKKEGFPNGARAVVTGGLSVSTPGSTSIMEIREMNAA